MTARRWALPLREAELLAALVEERERYPASAVRERSRERLERWAERQRER